MKRRSFLALLILFSLLLSGCGWDLPDDSAESTSPATEPFTEEVTLPVWETVTFSYKTPVNEAVLCTGGDPAYDLLVNKQNPLSSAFVPSNLTAVRAASASSLQLESKAEAALFWMMAEMSADGIRDVLVTSAYRDYRYQDVLYNMYVANEMSSLSAEAYAYFGAAYLQTHYLNLSKTGLSRADAEAVVSTYSAKPGYSEHQSGLCVDFIHESATALDRSFENTAAFAWLSKNAYRFGFILRYPADKESVTGYSYEPWHFRFVGRERATELFFRGAVLEEV